MKKILTFMAAAVTVFIVAVSCGSKNKENSSEAKTYPEVYDDAADPVVQIKTALSQADESGKYVICQVGGNWCPWCLKFADFITSDENIRKVIDENYVYTHINVYHQEGDSSRRIYNEDALRMLGNPTRFGYPVLVVLDAQGNVLHIQDSGFLEENDGYNEDKVLRFFNCWTPAVVEKAADL